MEVLVYISIALATILYVLGFIMLFRYKSDKVKRIERELQALNNILDSCDAMVNELNNLSDYIITNVETKSSDLKSLLSEADKRIKYLDSQMKYISNNKSSLNINEEKEHEKNKTINEEKSNIEEIEDNLPDEKKAANSFSSVINAYKKNLNLLKNMDQIENQNSQNLSNDEKEENDEKTEFMINSKEKEIIELSQQGLDTTEIAKRLGVGKGEIELILGLKK